jgi:hypothetical protein
VATGSLLRRTAASAWQSAAESILLQPEGTPAEPLEVLESDPTTGLLMLGLLPLLAEELKSPVRGSKVLACRLLLAVLSAGPAYASAIAAYRPVLESLHTVLAPGEYSSRTFSCLGFMLLFSQYFVMLSLHAFSGASWLMLPSTVALVQQWS